MPGSTVRYYKIRPTIDYPYEYCTRTTRGYSTVLVRVQHAVCTSTVRVANYCTAAAATVQYTSTSTVYAHRVDNHTRTNTTSPSARPHYIYLHQMSGNEDTTRRADTAVYGPRHGTQPTKPGLLLAEAKTLRGIFNPAPRIPTRPCPPLRTRHTPAHPLIYMPLPTQHTSTMPSKSRLYITTQHIPISNPSGAPFQALLH